MKEKNVPIITVFLILAVCGSIAYFMVFRSGMKFTDTKSTMKTDKWKITLKLKDEKLTDSTSDEKVDKLSIKIKGHLNNKDSEIKYILSIKNSGTIDANLYSILNSNQDIDVKLIDNGKEIKENLLVKAKEEKEIELIIKSNKDEELDFENDLKLVFNQYEG